MADTFEIEIATPEKLVIQQHAEFAEIPGKDG
jgi:F0F1-type ATP synthase epsilon subunit